MGRRELAWRLRAEARAAVDRARATIVTPRWRRADLRGILAPDTLPTVTRAAASGDWTAAHRELSREFAASAARFVIGPAMKDTTARRIRACFPEAPLDAAARADRILAGEYDLLGYRGLRFDDGTGSAPDWQYDPVHHRRPPRVFWTQVPFLDPSIGDHKIIWELNRHQHWLTLGRAYWLTGEPRYRARALCELASWLDANPPLSGINWASMLELAFRSISWVWAIHFFADPAIVDDSPWLVDLIVALDRQLDHVERNLSYYFSPNTHLLGEALALYVAGRALPQLRSSGRRSATGRTVLLAEMPRQIAADGGHCERSAHYHRYALDFYLLALCVARLTHDPATGDFERAVARLGFAARLLADDRGRLPHLGDDDGGVLLPMAGRAVDDVRDSLAAAAALANRPDLTIGAPPEACYWLLAQPHLMCGLDAVAAAPPAQPPASAALPDTGYYISRSPAGDHIVIDAGPHGYQNGGHAHADALSLTFSVHGIPLLIDPGTGCYTIDLARRDRLRLTASHNTLTVDERPQSVPDGAFQWALTAQASARRWRANAGFDYLEASHDGYAPLEHRRHVLVLHGDLLVVADLVAGSGLHRADAHWHVHPRWRVTAGERRATFVYRGERIDLMVAHGVLQAFSGDEDAGLGWHAPVYGREEAATTIRVSHAGSAPHWIVSVFGVSATNELTGVEVLPVWAEAGALQHSLGVRITRAETTEIFAIAQRQSESTWRVGEIETDAHMLFCRHDGRQISRVALVDGSRVRASGRRGFAVVLPREMPDVHVDLGVDSSEGSSSDGLEARVSNPAPGARVESGGREVPIAPERRAAARPRARRLTS